MATRESLQTTPFSSSIGAILLLASSFVTRSFAQNTALEGIHCELQPEQPATRFSQPVTPTNGKTWIVTNVFGNVVTNKDIRGLPKGYWQHTGVDYVLGGSTATSEQKTIYAVGNGVVVFSTRSNKNPIPQRGGLVIIKHVSPRYGYDVPRYEGYFTADSENFSITQPAFKTEQVYSYYLHLDPNQIMVAQGRQVTLGEAIGQTYSLKDYRSGRFTYPPHSHFEIWKTCSTMERNGYDSGGKQFQEGMSYLLIDPISFLQQFSVLPSDRPEAPRRWEIHLTGPENWHDTGIAVKRGQTINISASGRVTWNPNLENNNTTAGPDGVAYNAYRLQIPQDFPMPEANVASLIMRIGSVQYAVGSKSTIEVREAGTIQLMINDRYNGLKDNTGELTVLIQRQ